MSSPHDVLIDGAPRWRRPGMRLLFALALRPRGAAVLARMAPLDQAADGLLAMVRYDDPAQARALGWDADAVVERGRALRRSGGRR
jgi:hypothetical protein